MKIFLLGAVVMNCLANMQSTAAGLADTPAPREEQWCLDHHESLKKRAANGGFEIMLIGDSITWEWEANENTGLKVWNELADLKPASFAVSGDRTEHVLWRLLDGELNLPTPPKAFVLMIGTNNTGQREDKPEEIARGVEGILAVLQERFPKIPVLLYGIFPRNSTRADFARGNNDAANALIQKLANGKQVRYVNINDRFLHPDGTLNDMLFRDGVHLSEEGYKVWADSLKFELK